MSIFPQSWGKYPPEYNREIHGPYNPSVYYGKRDTPFGDVKLGELLGWFSRRRKTPRALVQAISRTYFKYHLNWMAPKKPGPYFIYHSCALLTVYSWLLDHKRYTLEKKYRYH